METRRRYSTDCGSDLGHGLVITACQVSLQQDEVSHVFKVVCEQSQRKGQELAAKLGGSVSLVRIAISAPSSLHLNDDREEKGREGERGGGGERKREHPACG